MKESDRRAVRGKRPGAVTPMPAGSRAERARPAASGVRLPAVVLCTDLRGFSTAAGRLAPAIVVKWLEDFFAVMTDAAVAHRATIERVISDGVQLVYGVPTGRKDDAARAVSTALAMQQGFLGLRNRWLLDGRREAGGLGLGVGIASGDVVMATVGLGKRRDCAAVGEPVGRAARLCAAAQRGHVLLDQDTYARAAGVLGDEVLFTSMELPEKGFAGTPVFVCQRRRAGLNVIPGLPLVDPVCGVAVRPRGAVRRRHAGATYCFCSGACAMRFAADPEGFLEARRR